MLPLNPLDIGVGPAQVCEQVKDAVVVKALDRQGKQVGLGTGVVLSGGEVPPAIMKPLRGAPSGGGPGQVCVRLSFGLEPGAGPGPAVGPGA